MTCRSVAVGKTGVLTMEDMGTCEERAWLTAAIRRTLKGCIVALLPNDRWMQLRGPQVEATTYAAR